MENDLFDIRLNEEGKGHIVRIYRLTRFVFWFGVVIETLMLYAAIRNYFRYRHLSQSQNPALYWEIRVYCVYMVVMAVLALLQCFYFLQFTRKARESLVLNESNAFNTAWYWMYRSQRISVICIAMNGLYFVYSISRGL